VRVRIYAKQTIIIIIWNIHIIKSRISGGRLRTGVRVYNILLCLHYHIILLYEYYYYCFLIYAIRHDDCHAKYFILLLLLCHRERCVALRVSPRRFVEEEYSNQDIIIIIIIVTMLHVYLRCRLLENSFKYSIRSSHV